MHTVAGVLQQLNPDTAQLHPIAFYSQKLHGPELNWHVHDKELYAIVNSIGNSF